jgi:hypothetical protein
MISCQQDARMPSRTARIMAPRVYSFPSSRDIRDRDTVPVLGYLGRGYIDTNLLIDGESLTQGSASKEAGRFFKDSDFRHRPNDGNLSQI